jgi:hypothetical protein
MQIAVVDSDLLPGTGCLYAKLDPLPLENTGGIALRCAAFENASKLETPERKMVCRWDTI